MPPNLAILELDQVCIFEERSALLQRVGKRPSGVMCPAAAALEHGVDALELLGFARALPGALGCPLPVVGAGRASPVGGGSVGRTIHPRRNHPHSFCARRSPERGRSPRRRRARRSGGLCSL
eukprot:4503007-Pyramimonas_sp.AAC.1